VVSSWSRDLGCDHILFVLLTSVCSHEGNASLLDSQEEGWCQRIPTLVPELERTANWPI
jgi:hypothetical protein